MTVPSIEKVRFLFPPIAALALLSSQGGEQHYKPGEIRKAREAKDVDNTLEAVTLVRFLIYQLEPTRVGQRNIK